MRNDKPNLIVESCVAFSIRLIRYCEMLESKKKFVIARQLLRSGTSIGANVFEAQNAESKIDFIHKMKIAAKECSQTKYWLELCKAIDSYSFDKGLETDLEVILKILSKIISSSKNNY